MTHSLISRKFRFWNACFSCCFLSSNDQNKKLYLYSPCISVKAMCVGMHVPFQKVTIKTKRPLRHIHSSERVKTSLGFPCIASASIYMPIIEECSTAKNKLEWSLLHLFLWLKGLGVLCLTPILLGCPLRKRCTGLLPPVTVVMASDTLPAGRSSTITTAQITVKAIIITILFKAFGSVL